MSVFKDAEGAVRSWARDVPGLAGVQRRVFFDIPADAAMPLVTVARLGGAPDAGEVPFDYARITFSVWARTKFEAVGLVGGLVEALHQMRYTKVGDVALRGAVVDSVLWSPDPDTKAARYIVDATVTVASA